MRVDIEAYLRRLGEALDAGEVLRVKNGGIVVPSATPVSTENSGKEHQNVRAAKREATASEPRPPTGQGQLRPRSSRLSWSSGRPWSPRDAAPLFVAELQRQYDDQLSEVAQAYPGARWWRTDEELWLHVESALLQGLTTKAHFIVCVSPGSLPCVKAWGFWGGPPGAFEWIGPRHTNFPDGSICAYAPHEGTWTAGDSLVKLIDLYSVWAVRHLHLRVFGRWPGFQAVHHSYERLLELHSDEYCGCDNYREKYGRCCEPFDRSFDVVGEAVRFTIGMGGGLRKPPRAIVKFLLDGKSVPELTQC